MANRMQRALDRISARLFEAAPVAITYTRGANSASINAVLGNQLLRVTDRQGNTKVERTDRDFIIAEEDLVLGGGETTPQRGDRINVIIEIDTETYEVMAPLGEAPWRYADPYHTLFRVHTKYIGIAAAGPSSVDDEAGNPILTG